jgi:hypothetical protein
MRKPRGGKAAVPASKPHAAAAATCRPRQSRHAGLKQGTARPKRQPARATINVQTVDSVDDLLGLAELVSSEDAADDLSDLDVDSDDQSDTESSESAWFRL